MTTDADPGRPERRQSDTQPPAGTVLEARIVRYDHQPDELTIFPREVPRGQRLTTWVSAEEGSFVDLDDWL